MADPGALWLQVAANPSDKALKQQYVDSLPEGDERAEPMRLSIKIKALSWGYERDALLKRYEESLNVFKKELYELEQACGAKICFDMGWPCMLTIDAGIFIQTAQYICTGLPIRHLNLTQVDNAPQVFEIEQLSKIASLNLRGQKLSKRTFNALLKAPNLTSLRWLDLSSTGMTDERIDAIAAESKFRELKYLGLENNPGTDPVDLTKGYGTDGISGCICPESIYLPERGKELQERFGELNWLWIVARFNGSRPDQFSV